MGEDGSHGYLLRCHPPTSKHPIGGSLRRREPSAPAIPHTACIGGGGGAGSHSAWRMTIPFLVFTADPRNERLCWKAWEFRWSDRSGYAVLND